MIEHFNLKKAESKKNLFHYNRDFLAKNFNIVLLFKDTDMK